MAHDVFISYSTGDKLVADAICASLEAEKVRCWIAPRDILAGVSWAEAISAAIEGSRVFVLVFSRTSNSSDDVFREISLAASSGIPIVSFRIHGVEPSKRMGYYLKPTHWLDAVDAPLLARIQDLLATVELLMQSPRPSPLPTALSDEAGGKKPARRSWFTPRRWALVAAAVIAIAVGVGLWAESQSTEGATQPTTAVNGTPAASAPSATPSPTPSPTPRPPAGRITSPKSGGHAHSPTPTVIGTLSNTPKGKHVWVAAKVGDLLWPKAPEIDQKKSKWRTRIKQPPDRISLVLLMVDGSGQQMIMRTPTLWNKARRWPGMAVGEIRGDTKQLDIVRNVNVQ